MNAERWLATEIPSTSQQPSILSFAKDIPNLCSLAGLACTAFAVYFSIIGAFHVVMICLVWAVAFDWADGLIARRMAERSGTDREFGGQLDVIIDVMSYGVAPAILLLSYGRFESAFLAGAFLLMATSALRLSYFSTFGLSKDGHYTGLALDNNNLVIVFLFLFESMFSHRDFSFILYASCLGLAALNVSSLKTPKLSGNPINVCLLAAYTIAITAIYGFKMT